MSKTYRQVIVPETIKTVVDKTLCDLCGRESEGVRDNWLNDNYDFEETSIKLSTGYRYHDDGERTTKEYHICPTCFNEKLIPWMKSQGAEYTETESYW